MSIAKRCIIIFFHISYQYPYELMCINFGTFQLAVFLVTIDANGLASPLNQRSSYGVVVPLSTYI